MKKLIYVLIAFVIVSTVAAVVFTMSYDNAIKAVDINNTEEIEVIIPPGSTSNQIITILDKKGLINGELYFKIYLKLNKVDNFKAGTYILSKNMDLKEIIAILEKGNSYNPDQIKIAFIEGLTIKKYAEVIEKNTNNKASDVLELLTDEKYLNELISKYWFITDDIKNPRIYYSLEGYLFPDTYIFKNKDVTVKEIFDKMLKQTENKLSKYKKEITSGKQSVHEILTLASIIELEGSNAENKKIISGVFHNRLKVNMMLGSDVTTFYGQRIEMKDHKIANYGVKDDYNTRVMTGYPASPICSPSMAAIEASINPTETKYYYFVADKNKKIYFAETYNKHLEIISDLKAKGLWL